MRGLGFRVQGLELGGSALLGLILKELGKGLGDSRPRSRDYRHATLNPKP